MCLRCFIHRSNCPPNNNIFPAVSVSLLRQRWKSHPSIHLHVAVDRSFWRKYSPRYRVISRTRCTQTVTRLQIIRFRTPILPSELLVSRRGKESMHALAHISRVHFCSRFSQSSDPTVSPLRHASLSPCASCVTDKKLDFHVIVDRLHGHARDILERQARENWVYRWIFTFLSPNGSLA